MAEAVGFEPTDLLQPTVFKTVSLNQTQTNFLIFFFGTPALIRTGKTTPFKRVGFTNLPTGVYYWGNQWESNPY